MNHAIPRPPTARYAPETLSNNLQQKVPRAQTILDVLASPLLEVVVVRVSIRVLKEGNSQNQKPLSPFLGGGPVRRQPALNGLMARAFRVAGAALSGRCL